MFKHGVIKFSSLIWLLNGPGLKTVETRRGITWIIAWMASESVLKSEENIEIKNISNIFSYTGDRKLIWFAGSAHPTLITELSSC